MPGRYSSKGAESKSCSFDPIHNITIHRFEPGACRCRCGDRIVRAPVKEDRFGGEKFGRALYDDPLDGLDRLEVAGR